MSLILFPHSNIPESIIRKITSFLGPLTIFQPWFMEPPAFLEENEGLKVVKILKPPKNLKPSDGFNTILSESHRWMEQNLDKSYTEILKADQGKRLTENTTWEIRQMINLMDQSSSGSEEDQPLRWHITLHLAREIEDKLLEVYHLLKSLKDRDPLLKGSVEGAENVKGLLEDLTQFGSESLLDEYNFKQIIEAWFGLFGGYLKEKEMLITFNPYVMEHVSGNWDSFHIEDESSHSLTIRLKIPDLPLQGSEKGTEIERDHLISDKIRELRDLIFGLSNDPVNNSAALDKLSKEFEEPLSSENSGEKVGMTVRYIRPPLEDERQKLDMLIKNFYGRTIILIEDKTYYG